MKSISKEECDKIVNESYGFLTQEFKRQKDFGELREAGLNELAVYVEETIGIKITGKSINNLKDGAEPKNSTINILCAFLLVKHLQIDINNHDFKVNILDNRFYVRRYYEFLNNSDINYNQNTWAKKSNLNKILLWSGLFSLLALTSLFLYSNSKLLFVDFSSTKPELYVDYSNQNVFPKEIKVTYDLKERKNLEGAYLGFMNEKIKLKKLTGDTTLTVMIPHYYSLNLFSKDVILSKKNFLVSSSEWQGFLNKDVSLTSDYFENNGEMHFNHLEILKTKSDEYYTSFNKFKDFGVKSRDFVLEADIKNPKTNIKHWAYDISVDIVCIKNNINFNLLSPDALQYAQLKIGDMVYNNKNSKEVVAKLGVVIENYQKLKVECLDGHLKISIDNQILVDQPFKNDLGQIVGIQFYFKGSGYVKNIRLNNILI